MVGKKAHGVVSQKQLDRKDDYLFRISIKGLIRDGKGNVLVVKEAGRTWWDLPGGGMDHAESIHGALSRELHEEVGLSGDFTYRILAAEEPSFLEHPRLWQMRLIFEVKPMNMSFEPGKDGDEIAFINPLGLKDSESSAEQKVYAYSLLASLL